MVQIGVAVRLILKCLFPLNMVEILLLGQNSCIWDISFKIHEVLRSIPSAKSCSFIDFQGFEVFYFKNKIGTFH